MTYFNPQKLKLLWQSTRPHQWLKNVFILSGLVFGRFFNDVTYIFPVFLSVIAFTLVASAGYIFNDLIDREVDAQHPQKSSRPIASGSLGIYEATGVIGILLLTGLGLGLYISLKAFVILAGYCLLTATYSIKLKHLPWIEMICIVTGFVLRVLLGTWGVGIAPSAWIIGCSASLAFFLVLAKRRSEQLLFRNQLCYLRKVLNTYKQGLLNKTVYLAAFLCFLTYTCYAVIHGIGLTSIFVALGIWRYLFLLQLRGEEGIELDVAHEFLQDRILQVTVFVWLLMLLWY